MAPVIGARLVRAAIVVATTVFVLYLTNGKPAVIGSMLLGSSIIIVTAAILSAPLAAMHRQNHHSDAKFWGTVSWAAVVAVAVIIIVLLALHALGWFTHLWSAAGIEGAIVGTVGIALGVAGPKKWH